MTNWSVPAVARFWIRNGGDPNEAINACAVAWAESRGNDHAHSLADDWGLWQINSENFAAQHVTRATIVNPDINARVAIRMSGNGTNWGPWCTCYTDPGPMCGRLHLGSPQSGSPAYNELGYVSEALSGLVAHDPVQLPAGAEDEINSAWGYLQDFVGGWGRDLAQYLTNINNATRRL